MRLIKDRISLCIIALLIICLTLFTNSAFSAELQNAPLNPEFIKYQEKLAIETAMDLIVADDGSFLGEVPAPVDMSHIKSVYYPEMDAAPATYDLRSYGKVPPIKDQGACGSCWTFATMASLESCQLTANSWNFSEQDLNTTHGFDYAECDGGNSYMSNAYLARWNGPAWETDVPYPYGGTGSPGADQYMDGATGSTVRKHVQNVIYVPARSSYTDNNTIKALIQTYGAVYVSFYYSGSYIDSTDENYYYNGGTSANHAVAVVGWDDSYSSANFKPGTQPPADGAFLIRNSWGTGRHTDGYFWLSYYDTSFNLNACFYNVENNNNYGKVYQYDPLGWISSSGYGITTAWGANIFTATADGNLKAVSFYATDFGTSYEIYIYTGVTAGYPTSGALQTTKTGSLTYPGYYTINLDSLVSITSGGNFSVVIKFTNTSYTYPVAQEYAYPGYSSGATASTGESFISSNGSSWTDKSATGYNICIKAFTASTPKALTGPYLLLLLQ